MTERIARKGFWVALLMLGAAADLHAEQSPSPSAQRTAQAPEAVEGESRQPDRAFRGLFAAGPQLGGLALTFSVSEEYTSDLAAEGSEGAIRPLAQEPGYFTGFRADLTYGRRTPRMAIGFRSEGSMRYYTTFSEYTMPRIHSAIDLSATLDRRRRSSLRVGQTVEYTPYGLALYQALSVPVLDQVGLGADRDDQLTDRSHYIYGSSLGYQYELTPRLTMSVDSQYRFTQSGDPTFDVRQFQGRVGVSRRFSPHVAFQAGYGFRRGELPAASAVRQIDSHDIDVGMAYNRPLTRSRRTFVSFNTGSAVFGDAGARQYRVVGSASVRHQMPKRWMLQIGYDRGLQIVEGFSDPFLTDAVVATMSGFVSPRVELSMTGGYSIGTVGFTSRGFDNAQGSARLRYALSRHLAIDGQYLFYRFGFAEGISLLSFVPRQQERHVARVTLAVWLPMSR